MGSLSLTKSLSYLLGGLLCLGATSSNSAQTKPEKQDLEVLRINTELVQSPVMVFDKQGRFVDGLQRDQFELRVDGRAQPISFFDRVTAGTADEAKKLETARKGATASAAPVSAPRGSVYGRTLIFFIDDLHLSADSINRLRAALLRFFEQSIGQNDRVLLTTATGQLGFLQQLTDNQDVLHAAAEKMRSKQSNLLDEERPPMGPYQALGIELNNTEVLKYYIEIYFADAVQQMFQGAPTGSGKDAAAIAQMKGEQGRRIAEVHVRARARNLLHQYTSINAAAFKSLRFLMSDSLEIPGSKLIFVVSDGFYLNRGVPGELQKLNEVTSAAIRAGAIIYSIQASGLGSNYPDAKTDLRQGSRMPMNLPRSGNDQELQAPLYTLAVDTGGRALFNSNSIDSSIKQALNETSEYYLLAWRPEAADQRAESYKEIQVTVKDRPELTVRVHKGYLASDAKAASTAAQSAKSTTQSNGAPNAEQVSADEKLLNEKVSGALSKSQPTLELPVSVNVRFSDVPDQGQQIMVGTEIWTSSLFGATNGDQQPRLLDLFGVVLNDEGKTVASFKGQLKAEATSSSPDPSLTQTTDIKLSHGLYQVRVVARDQKSGLVGSAFQWIRVPDLAQKGIALSSLFVGDRKRQEQSDSRIPLSINHHFTSDSRLRFFASIYNTMRPQENGAKPDVSLQTRILRDDQAIFTGPVVQAATDGIDDLTRLPYAAEISLRTLRPGAYVLELKATDNIGKSSATQRVKFVVD